MTNAELIELLEQHNPEAEVRLAVTTTLAPLQLLASDVVVLDDDVVYVVAHGEAPDDGPFAPDAVFASGDHDDNDWR